MRHAQPRVRSLKWIGRGALVALAGLIALGVQPALPALASTWSSPVQLPGSCGSSVAVNQAGAMAAGGTFTASDGTTHVQVCTSPNGKTWQATDLGQGGNAPSSGHRIAVAVTPAGQTVAVWGYWPCSTCTAVVEAAVHPAGGSWGTPVTLSTGLGLDESDGGLVIGTDGPATSSPAGPRTPVTPPTRFSRPAAAAGGRPRRCRSKAAWARRIA